MGNKTPFGAIHKSAERNYACFLFGKALINFKAAASLCTLNIHYEDAHLLFPLNHVELYAKFRKYEQRIRQILDGTHPSIILTQVSRCAIFRK